MNNINDDMLELLDYLEILYDDNNVSYNCSPVVGSVLMKSYANI